MGDVSSLASPILFTKDKGMIKKKANRRRNHMVCIWMNDEEYNYLKERVKKTGITQQAFIINSVYGAKIIPAEGIEILKSYSGEFDILLRQIRGLASNVNQMAHIANKHGYIPEKEELQSIVTRLSRYREKGEQIWQSIRSALHQRATVH